MISHYFFPAIYMYQLRSYLITSQLSRIAHTYSSYLTCVGWRRWWWRWAGIAAGKGSCSFPCSSWHCSLPFLHSSVVTWQINLILLIRNVISLLLGFILRGEKTRKRNKYLLDHVIYSVFLFRHWDEIDRSVRDVSGDSFVAGSGRKSKMAIGAGKVVVIHGDGDDPFNGSTPHDARAVR